MKLYSFFRSSAAYRVRIALALKGLSYDYLIVHLAKGEQYHPSSRPSIRRAWCRCWRKTGTGCTSLWPSCSTWTRPIPIHRCCRPTPSDATACARWR